MAEIKLHGVAPQTARWPGKSEHLLLLSLLNPDDPESAAIAAPCPVSPTGYKDRYQGDYPLGRLTANVVSLRAAMVMGFASTTTLKVSGSAKATYFVQDLCVYTGPVPNPLNERTWSCVESISWGVGARICVAAWSLEGDARFTDIRDVAARTQSKTAGSHLDVQVFGADAEIFSVLRPLLSRRLSSFDVDAFAELAKAREKLCDFFFSEDKTKARRLVPEPVAAQINFHRLGHRPGDEPVEHLLAGETFALNAVAHQGLSADAAVKHDWFDPSVHPRAIVHEDTVRRTYQDLFGLEGAQVPDNKQRDLARDITRSGRF
ncbi:MAG TPA: hypothetical protein PKW35_04055 [Nannocystaceae bacterium]|nr:hypothetical protein [Nannocystaceae bacterium]